VRVRLLLVPCEKFSYLTLRALLCLCMMSSPARRPLMSQRGKGTRFRPKALRKLASEVFGIHTFQQDDGGHDSIDDAAMSLELYGPCATVTYRPGSDRSMDDAFVLCVSAA